MTEPTEILITRTLSRLLGRALETIPREASFYDLGVDSLNGLRLIGSLGADLQLEIDPMVVLEHPSIAELAAHLDGLMANTRLVDTRE